MTRLTPLPTRADPLASFALQILLFPPCPSFPLCGPSRTVALSGAFLIFPFSFLRANAYPPTMAPPFDELAFLFLPSFPPGKMEQTNPTPHNVRISSPNAPLGPSGALEKSLASGSYSFQLSRQLSLPRFRSRKGWPGGPLTARTPFSTFFLTQLRRVRCLLLFFLLPNMQNVRTPTPLFLTHSLLCLRAHASSRQAFTPYPGLPHELTQFPSLLHFFKSVRDV